VVLLNLPRQTEMPRWENSRLGYVSSGSIRYLSAAASAGAVLAMRAATISFFLNMQRLQVVKLKICGPAETGILSGRLFTSPPDGPRAKERVGGFVRPEKFPFSRAHPSAVGSAFQAITGSENPTYQRETGREESERHREADSDADVRRCIEAPAKAADQIHDRIEQADGAPPRRQHVDRIERAAEERERRDDQHRDELQLLEAFRPDTEDEAEQAEGARDQHQERDHP